MESSYAAQTGVNVWSAPTSVDLTYTQTLDSNGAVLTAQFATSTRTVSGGNASNNTAHPPGTIRLRAIEESGPAQGIPTTHGWVADTAALGWDYQAFGVWQKADYQTDRTIFMAGSAGAATAAGSIPTTGAARFEGKLFGLYTQAVNSRYYEATADVTVTASFADRRVDFTSSALNMPGIAYLNAFTLSGGLTYAPGQNRLSGTVNMANSTLTGTATAQFYGPGAEEIGGAMVLTSPTGSFERLTAAFGAKRR